MLALNDAIPVRTRVGMNGLLTPRLSVLGAIGYSATFLADAPASAQQFDSIIGQAEVRFYLTDNPDAVELVARSVSWRQGERFRQKQAIVLDSSRGRARIDAMFSGHTHGGQVALPGVGPIYVPSRFGTRYEGGLIQGPRFPIIVSRGVGMSILPVRFGVPPEIVEVTLTRA